MKVKIAKQVQFKDASDRLLSNYQVYYKGRSFWVSEKDFKNHKELMSIEDDELMLREPLENYYVVVKKENKNGKFLVIMPKENVAKSYSLDPAKRLPKDMAEEVLTEYIIKSKEITSQNPVAQSDQIPTAKDSSTDIDESSETKSPKEIENSFRVIDPEKLRGLNLRPLHLSSQEKEASPKKSSSEGSDDLVEIGGLTLKKSQFKGIVSPEELEGWLEDTEQKKPDVPDKLTKDKFIQAIGNKPRSPFIDPPKPDVVKDKTNATGIKKVISDGSAETSNDLVSADQKIKFINSLITLSTKQKIDDKTRERLFGLVGKELEKAGGVEEEILREVREIKEGLILRSQKVEIDESTTLLNTDLSSLPDETKSRPLMSHNPKNTIEFLRLFKFEDGSGFKELVHDTNFNTFTPEMILNKVKTHPNFISSEIGEKVVDFKPIHLFVQLKTKELINLFETIGIDFIKKTGEHPYEHDQEYTRFTKSFKKNYRYGSGKEYTNLKEQIIQIASQEKYKTSFSVENLLFLPNPQKFDIRANFFAWTDSISFGIRYIFDGIKDHGSINGIPYNIDEKTIEIECWKSEEAKSVYLSILDKHSIAGDPQRILDFYSNSSPFKLYFRSLCDWSVEVDYDGGSFRLEILNEGNHISIVPLEERVGGYKHILKFYDSREK